MTASQANVVDVVVVGGGAVGATLTLELARRGAKVTLVERGPTVACGCSAANAGVVGASHVLPFASSHAIGVALGSLIGRDVPFSVRAKPALVPWIGRFVMAARPRRQSEVAAVLSRLAAESARLHAALGAELDVGYCGGGFLAAFETADALVAATSSIDPAFRADVLDGPTLARRVDSLGPGLCGAISFPDDAHVDPGAYVESVAKEAERLGALIRTGTEVFGIDRAGARVKSLLTSVGTVSCESVVLATGAWGPQLGQELGVRLPVQGGKGYAIEFEGQSDLPCPIYFPQRHVVVTPLSDRIRLTGMLELCGTDQSVDLARIAAIRRIASAHLPFLDPLRVSGIKLGLRPCSPDGLPIVGRVPGVSNGWVSTGHGLWGLQLAPVTGRLLADAIEGYEVDPMLSELSPARF